MRARLTKDLLARLEAKPGRDMFIWDTVVKGLGVGVRASGAMSYVLQYRSGSGRGSSSVRITLDSCSSLALEDARKAARNLLGRVALGHDVRAERRVERQAQERTVSAVITAYDKDFEARQVSPYHRRNTVSVLRRGLEAALKLDLASLSRQDLVGLMEAIEKPGARQSFRQRLTPFLNFAVNRGLLSHNPLAGWKQPRRSKALAIAKIGRTLTPEEIRSVWTASEEPTTFNFFVRVMLLTGLRKTETASLEFSWIDEGVGAIVVPAHRMKSGKPHAVPLTPLLRQGLTAIPRSVGTDLFFPVRGRNRTWTTMSGYGQMLARLHRRSRTDGWTIYDLRRTYRSKLGELGFDLDLCERMIAHSRGNLVERYDRSTRWSERVTAAEAISQWVSRLSAVVGDDYSA